MNKTEFKNKKVNFEKLEAFGFCENKFVTDIFDGKFSMEISVSQKGEVFTKVVDKMTDEEYVLHHVKSATGAFVGRIREETECILSKIKDACFDDDVYKNEQAKAVINSVLGKYNSVLEFPWDDENSVVRRTDNKKWYAVFLKILPEKIGLSGNEKIEVLNIKMPPEDVVKLADNKKYFNAYHMNKKHWVTIPFGKFVDTDEILEKIEQSYNLAK